MPICATLPSLSLPVLGQFSLIMRIAESFIMERIWIRSTNEKSLINFQSYLLNTNVI